MSEKTSSSKNFLRLHYLFILLSIQAGLKGLFTRKSDFALGLQVYNANNNLKWTSLLRNRALKSDV
jgi:hypothetical protein